MQIREELKGMLAGYDYRFTCTIRPEETRYELFIPGITSDDKTLTRPDLHIKTQNLVEIEDALRDLSDYMAVVKKSDEVFSVLRQACINNLCLNFPPSKALDIIFERIQGVGMNG